MSSALPELRVTAQDYREPSTDPGRKIWLAVMCLCRVAVTSGSMSTWPPRPAIKVLNMCVRGICVLCNTVLTHSEAKGNRCPAWRQTRRVR
jgi:hypothetical protein